MKKICILICCLVTGYVASGQILVAIVFGDKLNSGKLEFGLMTGPVLSNISNADAKAKMGLDLGLYFDVNVSDRFVFHPEVIVKSALGAKGITPYATGDKLLDSLFKGGEVLRKFKAISLPFMCRYRIAGLLFVEAGPQINWMVNAKDIFKTKENDGKVSYTTDINSSITMLDIGFAGGLAYRLRKYGGISFALRYARGITDIEKNTAGSQQNSTLLFNVYIPIGATKATKLKDGK
ncbi:MAG: outer membrane beta-barrel protein [Filimonas sp.]|nr:outer membrane beta-barrel protein [Filimonas sp.]